MTKFEVLEKADGWHVRLLSGLLDEVFETRDQAVAFSQTFVREGVRVARIRREQGDAFMQSDPM